MRNVGGILYLFLLFVAMFSLTGCNPLAAKSSSDANFLFVEPKTVSKIPKITGYRDFVFPNYAVVLGNNVSFNIDDYRTGTESDELVTYSCSYDQVADGAVVTSGNCNALPGIASFNAISGIFSWTPVAQSAIGFYEIKIEATDINSKNIDAKIMTIDVRPNYTTTNMLANHSANFSNQATNQTNQTIWKDLFGAYDGSLLNFSFGGATGWKGTGISSDPYRLTFDGVDDYVNLGNLGSSSTSLSFEGWINSSQMTTNPKGTIIGNADASGKGLIVREAKGYKGRIEVVKGTTSYADEVLADNPISYLRMGEVSGEAVNDIGSAPPTPWTRSNATAYEKDGPAGGDKAIQFSGTGNAFQSATTALVDPVGWGGLTYEVWANFSAYNSSTNTFFMNSNWNNTTAFFWFTLSSAGNYCLSYNDGVTARSKCVAIALPSLNVWHHFALTLDFASNTIGLYLDGATINSSVLAFPANHTNMNGGKVLFIGDQWNVATDAIPGQIAEPAVYNYALSGTRIVAHYNAAIQKRSCLSSRLDDSKWNHFAAIYDDPSTALKLFTNGNADCSITTSASTINGSSAVASMGATLPAAGSPTAGTYFNGSISDVRSYNAPLTTAQVDSNFLSQTDEFNFLNSAAGLNLWYKADAITGKNNNDPISIWPDSSSAARDATQATPANQPVYKTNAINGKPSVKFDGVDDYMSILTAGTSWTIFTVATFNGFHGGYNQILSGPGLFTYLSTSFGTTLQWYLNPPVGWNSWQVVSPNIGTTYHIQTYRISNSQADAFCDGVLQFSSAVTNAYTNPSSLNTLGDYYFTGQNRWLNGEIAEVISYSTTLSDPERRRIEGYLKAKYGF